MIKTKWGKTECNGDFAEILADFMHLSEDFIGFLKDGFKISDEKAIVGFSELIEVVKDGFIDYDEERECTRIHKILEDLSENKMNQRSAKMIVIEADSPEDAMRQVKEVLTDIMETEGDE